MTSSDPAKATATGLSGELLEDVLTRLESAEAELHEADATLSSLVLATLCGELDEHLGGAEAKRPSVAKRHRPAAPQAWLQALEDLGWERAAVTYRPFLSSNELGALIEEGGLRRMERVREPLLVRHGVWGKQ